MINDEDCALFDADLWRNLAYVDADGDGVRDSEELVQVTCFGQTPPPGYTLNDQGLDALSEGTGTILNDDAAALAIDSVSHSETDEQTATFVFTVTLSAPVALETTVDYTTADGTATVADNDYQPKSGTLTFAAGQQSQTVTVLVNGDVKVEDDETFFVNLNDAKLGGATDARVSILGAQGTGTILNDDPWLTHLSASPDPVIYPGSITLTAHAAPGGDGLLAEVAFYRDEQLLGSVSDGGDGWSLSVATTGWALGRHTLSAAARNLDDTWSDPVSVTASVYAEHPPVLFGAVPAFARKEQRFTVDNGGQATITVQAAGWSGPFTIQPPDGASGEQAWQVEPGSSRQYVIVFAPVEAGELEARLTLVGDDGTGSVARISGLGVAGWRNPLDSDDVNGDGVVTPQDVLSLINEINRNAGGTLSPRTAEQPGLSLYLDPNGDGDLTPQDVLQVINRLNRESSGPGAAGGAEGEAGTLYAQRIEYGWLAAAEAPAPLPSGSVPAADVRSGLSTELRADGWQDAEDELARWTGLEQQDRPGEDAVRRGRLRGQDADKEEGDDGDLMHWDAYFRQLMG